MKVWAVANQKGGVGKTTTVVSLGGLLAHQGRRVLLMDLDPHGSLTSYFKCDPDNVQSSIMQLFDGVELNHAEVSRLIRPSEVQGLDFIPAATTLATLERKCIGKAGAGLVIAKALAAVADEYDYVIMDTPPLLGVLLVNAIAACEAILLPVQTEFLAIKGLEGMIHTLQMVMRSQQRSLPYVVVPTMFDRRTQACNSSLLKLRKSFSDHIWPGSIPIDTRFRDASMAGLPANQYAPSSRGNLAYASLLNYLI